MQKIYHNRIVCGWLAGALLLLTLSGCVMPDPTATPSTTTTAHRTTPTTTEKRPTSPEEADDLGDLLVDSPVTSLTFMNPDFSETKLTTTDQAEIDGLIRLMETIPITRFKMNLPDAATGIQLYFRHENGKSTRLTIGKWVWWDSLYSIKAIHLTQLSDYVSQLMIQNLPKLDAPDPKQYLQDAYGFINLQISTWGKRWENNISTRPNYHFAECLTKHMQTLSLWMEKPVLIADTEIQLMTKNSDDECETVIHLYEESNLLSLTVYDTNLSNPMQLEANTYYYTVSPEEMKKLCADLMVAVKMPNRLLHFAFAFNANSVTLAPNPGAEEHYRLDSRNEIDTVMTALQKALTFVQFADDASVDGAGAPSISFEGDGYTLHLLLDSENGYICVDWESSEAILDCRTELYQTNAEDLAVFIELLNGIMEDAVTPPPSP